MFRNRGKSTSEVDPSSKNSMDCLHPPGKVSWHWRTESNGNQVKVSSCSSCGMEWK